MTNEKKNESPDELKARVRNEDTERFKRMARAKEEEAKRRAEKGPR